MLDVSCRGGLTEDLILFRDTVRNVFGRHLIPNLNRFEAQGLVDRTFWRACGKAGLLCPTIKELDGGPGLDVRFNAVVGDELGYSGSSAGITLQSDIVAEYVSAYGTPAQKLRYPHHGRSVSFNTVAHRVTGAGVRSGAAIARRRWIHE